ncbi:MAG: hypothetical protein ACHQIL_06935 [Steroidobacterales bacterium]
MNSPIVPVIDFRRRRMTLQWHVPSGTWTAFDEPPAIVHGVGFIRASGPNIGLYAQSGDLLLQVDTSQFMLTELMPLISCSRTLVSLGLRRRFRVESSGPGLLYGTTYWAPKKDDFFVWLASAARHPDWYRQTGERWTEGLTPAALRAEVNPPIPPE